MIKLLEAHMRLRFLCALFAFACAFFAIFQMGWLLQASHELRWVGSVVGFSLLLRSLVLRGKRWALMVGALGVCVWWVFSLSLALRWHELELGFFSLFMLFAFGLLFYWMRSELHVSFLDPQMGWFQGYPRPIAHLSSAIQWKTSPQDAAEGGPSELLEAKVSRIDSRGVYLFFQNEPAKKLKQSAEWKSKASDLVFYFSLRGSKPHEGVRFMAHPMSFCERGSVLGIGFEWILMNRDESQRLALFLGELRRSGYVSAA